MSRETRIAEYEGPAELVWGSWVIEGKAQVKEHATEAAPVGPREGISAIPDLLPSARYVGAFTAASGTEPSLLSSVATALGESYNLRWQQSGRNEELTVAVTARHGHRIHFESRG